MPLKRRTRRLDDSVYGAPVYYGFAKPQSILYKPATLTWKGFQFTESEGHRKSRDGNFHEGGPFFTVSVRPDIHYRNVELKGTVFGEPCSYKGPIVIRGVPVNYGDFLSTKPIADCEKLSDNSFLDPLGAIAISEVDPMNSNAETGTAIAEIAREGRLPIPGIQAWKQRTELAKAAGSEYLNAVFGWLPLVDDVLSTAQSVLDMATIIENYRSASGTRVSREFEFPHEVSETTQDIYSGQCEALYAGNVPGFNDGTAPTVTRRRYKAVRRWFSGEFTYSAANGKSFDDIVRAKSDAEKLFGSTLTPDVLWELTPWSWAVDWFSNASNVIHNIGAFTQAGLVMRYGYIMEETHIVDTYEAPGTGLKGASGAAPTSQVTYNVKRRRDANPFGFGLEWEGLSPTQLAILAALGITRLR